MKENYLIKTEFDGREALIIGDHPHKGESVKCIGAAKTNAGYGLLFKEQSSNKEFFVFKQEYIMWLD